jgi:histone-lysine N-methyltransferase EZH2
VKFFVEEKDELDDPDEHRTPSKRGFRGATPSSKSPDQSVGTDSPLATRIREKRSRVDYEESQPPRDKSPREAMARRKSIDQQSHVQQPSFVEIKNALGQLQQTVLDDHAEAVKWLLHDARKSTMGTKSPFMDTVSPFASMKPVIAPPELMLGKKSVLQIDTYVSCRAYLIEFEIEPMQANRKKPARSSTYLITTKVASNVPRVPKYSFHTITKRNILCADDEQLKYMPFLGDSKGDVKDSVFKRLKKELDEVYSAQRSGSTQYSELASKLRAYIDRWLEHFDLGLDRQALIRYIARKDSDSFGEKQKGGNIHKAFRSPSPTQLAEIAETLSSAFQEVFEINITAVILPDQRLKDRLEKLDKLGDSTLGRSHSETPGSHLDGAEYTTERLGTYTNLTCLICGAISCQTHGDYHRVEIENPNDSEMGDIQAEPSHELEYIHVPLGMHYDEILRKQDARLSEYPWTTDKIKHSAEPPCSEECYRTFDYQGRTVTLGQEHVIALKSFINSMRPENLQTCQISFLLDVPCWKVHAKIQEINLPTKISERTVPGRSKGIDWYDNKRKTLKSDWQELTEAHLHQERTQANPVSLNLRREPCC